VQIPGYGHNRLNSAYADGYYHARGSSDAKRAAGADLLIRTVEGLTGLNIDHFVLVSLMGFVTISDAIGGVPINLCHSVNDTVKWNSQHGQDGGSGFKMSKGHHLIKGVQALEFVRQRHNLPNGDLDRTARQRYFLAAAFRKVASAGTLFNPGRLSSLISAVNKSVWVDSTMNMFDLARQMSSLSANKISGRAIPFEYFWDNSPVGSVEKINPDQVKSFIIKLIGSTDPAYTAAKLIKPGQVSVRVVNGGAAAGSATAAGQTLSKAGFRTTVDPRPQSVANTVIEYPSGLEAQAKTLAQYIPGAATDKTSDVSGVTLVLAGDGVTVHTTPAKPAAPKKPAHKPSQKKSKKALDSGCIN
jgi:LCP family protein required for cell wall assembly